MKEEVAGVGQNEREKGGLHPQKSKTWSFGREGRRNHNDYGKCLRGTRYDWGGVRRPYVKKKKKRFARKKTVFRALDDGPVNGVAKRRTT